MQNCWGIYKNNNFCSLQEEELTLDRVMDQFLKNVDIIYVKNKELFKGIIARNELCLGLRENIVTYNSSCIRVTSGAMEYQEALSLFMKNKRMRNIPVIDSDGRLLYEYIKNYNNQEMIIDYYSNEIEEFGINQKEIREKRIIVSLTSYGERLKTLPICIRSLMTQTLKPDKILLYIDHGSKDLIPDTLRQLEKQGLTIVDDVEDLKSHKKYYYSMQEYPEDLIITVDDDCIYEDTLVELLYESYQKYPNAISAKKVHKILADEQGILPYHQWSTNYTLMKEPCHQLMPIGVGGILYPPHCLADNCFNWELIEKLALGADDLWLKYMALIKGTKAVYVDGKYAQPITIPQSQINALYKRNLNVGLNDIYLYKLRNYFGLDLLEYCEE